MNVQMRKQAAFSSCARRPTVAIRPATSSRCSAVSVRSEISYVMVGAGSDSSSPLIVILKDSEPTAASILEAMNPSDV